MEKQNKAIDGVTVMIKQYRELLDLKSRHETNMIDSIALEIGPRLVHKTTTVATTLIRESINQL